MAWDEDRLHRWLQRLGAPRGLAGSPGHDAAVLRERAGRPAVCVDQTIEGVHFEPDAAPAKVGWKAGARALSDLAATAARPDALVLALRAPLERPERWIRAAIGGVRKVARHCGCDLVGGDLAAAPGPAALTVSALGTVEAGRPPGRDRARPGQCVVVTGPVGGSRLGRHLTIEPRVAQGRWLAAAGATAMMDVSDGLAWDLFRLARASGVRIDLELTPVHRDARRAARASGHSAEWHARHDGEDHELLATLPARACARVLAASARHAPELVRIGRVSDGRGLFVHDTTEGTAGVHAWRPGEGGFRHGG